MNVVTVIARILHREGGVKDVGDGKGLTRYGQTPGWLEEHNLPVPHNEIEAAANYTRWMAMLKLDEVCEIDLELGDGVVDFAVHSGHVPAIKALQRMLKVMSDGVIGNETLMALRGSRDKTTLALRFECQRIRYVGRVVTNNPENAKYAAGWANRQADRIESVLEVSR